MIPLTGTSLEETLAQMVLSFSGGGGGTPAVLDEKTITENGVYYPRDETPRLDGYNKVTVNVETYEEEYEEMKECCDEVVEVIQQYDPDYDPTDPTAPTIPEEIEDVIDDVSGYKFPVGTPIEDILDPVHPVIDPVDPVEDTTTHISIQIGATLYARNNNNPDFPADGIWIAGCRQGTVALAQQYGVNPTWEGATLCNTYGTIAFEIKATDTVSGNVYRHSFGDTGTIADYDDFAFTLKSFSINPTNGHINYTVNTHYIRSWGDHSVVDEDRSHEIQYDVSDLIGYGTGRYKVKNS